MLFMKSLKREGLKSSNPTKTGTASQDLLYTDFLPYKYFVFIDQSKNFKFFLCRKFKGYGPGNINLKTCVINYPDDSIQQYFRSDLFTAFPSCRFLGIIPGLPQRFLYIYSCKSLNKPCSVALFSLDSILN